MLVSWVELKLNPTYQSTKMVDRGEFPEKIEELI
jgi:hypothetical protein